MPIEFISEEIQKKAIEDFNKGKDRKDKLPLCNRNFNTGWPLMQFTLFIPTNEIVKNEIVYEPSRDGGQCMQYHSDLFGLAVLLSKITGRAELEGDPGFKIKAREGLDWNVVFSCSHGFHFYDPVLGIEIKARATGYSAPPTITFGDLTEAQWRKFRAKLNSIGPALQWISEPMTASYLQESYDSNIKIVFEGQMYIDIGKVLDACNDPELTEYFATLFKPEQALEFFKEKNLYPEFIPSANARPRALIAALEQYQQVLDKTFFFSSNTKASTKKAVHEVLRLINDPNSTTPYQSQDYVTKELLGILQKYKDILPEKLLLVVEQANHKFQASENEGIIDRFKKMF